MQFSTDPTLDRAARALYQTVTALGWLSALGLALVVAAAHAGAL